MTDVIPWVLLAVVLLVVAGFYGATKGAVLFRETCAAGNPIVIENTVYRCVKEKFDG